MLIGERSAIGSRGLFAVFLEGMWLPKLKGGGGDPKPKFFKKRFQRFAREFLENGWTYQDALDGILFLFNQNNFFNIHFWLILFKLNIDNGVSLSFSLHADCSFIFILKSLWCPLIEWNFFLFGFPCSQNETVFWPSTRNDDPSKRSFLPLAMSRSFRVRKRRSTVLFRVRTRVLLLLIL